MSTTNNQLKFKL